MRKFIRRIDAWYRGVCYLCEMPKSRGHWPGCDFWHGENLDLLIFRETGDGKTQ